MNNVITHRSEVRVRYADTDKMSIVYNGNYLVYFEIGRTELLRSHGLPYVELERAGYLLPVLEAFAQYKTPAVYDDLLEIEASYQVARAPTIRIEYVIRRPADGAEIARGYTLHAFVRTGTMKPVRPPQMFFDALEASPEAKRNDSR
jgi:acyl-CoA thioester hydrolase